MITYRHNWGEHRVYFYDKKKRLISVPAEWTSVVGEDAFVKVSAGRCLFRVEDLLELIKLIRNLTEMPGGSNKIE